MDVNSLDLIYCKKTLTRLPVSIVAPRGYNYLLEQNLVVLSRVVNHSFKVYLLAIL